LWPESLSFNTQAVAELGAKKVLATNIDPTTLQQLELGIAENNHIEDKRIVETKLFDLFGDEPIPMVDLVVIVDVRIVQRTAG
jgi:predicted nicotinamide N-methyase